MCLRQPDALLINSETKRAAKRRPESEREAPVTVIKMSEEQGRHGDWSKGVWEESRWEMSRHTGFVLCVAEMKSRQGNAQESRRKKQRKSGEKTI